MRKVENRDVVIHFRVSPGEERRIREKMETVGIHSRSAYLRKMALDGICAYVDYKNLKEINTLLRRCSNNLNQYAKKANETGSIYAVDIYDLQVRLDEIQQLQKESMKAIVTSR